MTDDFMVSIGADEVVDIVATAGGKLVGRTRLQKIAYLLEIGGFGGRFSFEYRHYGPYSEELSQAANLAVIFDYLEEDTETASWGGVYSIYRTASPRRNASADARRQLILKASSANPIELELAATAAFLALEGHDNPWQETKERKPDKVVGGRLKGAKKLYTQFQKLDLPESLPDI